MPFTPHEADPEADKTLHDLAAVVAGINRLDRDRRELLTRRRALVRRAQGYGVTADTLAEILGVSRGRVRQIEAGR